MHAAPVAPLTGTLLELDSPDQTRELDVPIPRLAGLDDIEIERVSFDVWSVLHQQDATTTSQPSDGAVTLSLNSAPGATVRLRRIEINDLRITASAAETFALIGSGAGGTLSNVVFDWNAEESTTTVATNADTALRSHVHILVRPSAGSGFGPPAAAVPHFAMPGDGGAMYGPALGGAWMTVEDGGSGKINVVVRIDPPLLGSRFSVLVGHGSQFDPHAGLPNEIKPATWAAAGVTAYFDVRPAEITVKARAQAAGDEEPLVAEFPGDPGNTATNVDFSGAARSLLKKAYPATQGADMGLKLLFTAGSPGHLEARVGNAAARFISRPLAAGPVPIRLLGAPESVDLGVSEQYRPSAVSFTLDGVYGPGRLTLDSDTAEPDVRHGFRIAGAVRIARKIILNAAEANLPLIRVGLFGRASEATELLLSLHKGDELRIGPQVADPLSLEVEPATTPAWHRREYAAPGLLPPHAAIMWLVAQATRGGFWWHGAMDDSTAATQRSADDGKTFSHVNGRPTLHVSVIEVDPASKAPTPLHPVSLSWSGGILNADVVGVTGQSASLPPDFRRFWIAQGSAHTQFLSGIPGLDGRLRLFFQCRRDVDLTVSEAVLTYNPWNA